MSRSDNSNSLLSGKTSRRSVLLGGAAALGAVTSAGEANAKERFRRNFGRYRKRRENTGIGHPAIRRAQVLDVRVDAARSYFSDLLPDQNANSDERMYDDYRGNFSKGFELDELGDVNPESYDSLIDALTRNHPSGYDAIRLDKSVRVRKLKNPQAAYKFEMSGLDGQATRTDTAPAFASEETAAEMAELYAMSLARNIPFIAYDSSRELYDLVDALNLLPEPVGPKQYGRVSPATIFRGENYGDLTGPYISQFLLRDVPYGPSKIVQQYAEPTPDANFMTEYDEWLRIRRGGAPRTLARHGAKYIYNARVLGGYVNSDVLFQAYFNAALIISSFGAKAVSTENPYVSSATQEGFISFGGPDVIGLLTKAGNLALTGAWYQKWLVHRRLRPEAYGGRLYHQIAGTKNYGLPYSIESSPVLDLVKFRTGTTLLPMAFPEGSPMHPAYPSGHATIGGACVTILKAFYKEDFQLTDNVQASADGSRLIPYGGSLTLGGELNKLANNIAIGRDWAGVHWRSDGTDGLLIGEQQAIGLLKDYSRTYNEQFEGFTLTKFDGHKIRIQNGRVKSV